MAPELGVSLIPVVQKCFVRSSPEKVTVGLPDGDKTTENDVFSLMILAGLGVRVLGDAI